MACLRCGRKLSDPVSIARGYGSTCYGKLGKDKKKNNSEEKQEEFAVDVNFLDELRNKTA
ncbi:MAG: DUF6011 domain-containing protein [Bacilli bacterium]|nr:DUF6011 domain-containing protein [Bacilli bacterium]